MGIRHFHCVCSFYARYLIVHWFGTVCAYPHLNGEFGGVGNAADSRNVDWGVTDDFW